MLRRSQLLTFFFFNDTATTEIYTLSLHDALPISISPGKNSVAWQQESRKKQSQERNKNMLSQSQRATILQLHAQGVKKREIARLLGISRLSVRKVLRSNSAQVPVLQREIGRAHV